MKRQTIRKLTAIISSCLLILVVGHFHPPQSAAAETDHFCLLCLVLQAGLILIPRMECCLLILLLAMVSPIQSRILKTFKLTGYADRALLIS
ncbi:MAG TPA: hypothetical protein VIM29_13935 [Bacillota bacterium]